MSEIKRVALNTLEPPKESDKVIKKSTKTLRTFVSLPQSNEDYYPEYNYKDELAAAKKKLKQNKDVPSNGVENGLDPFTDNDDDVRRIALEMEAKYGSGVSGVSKKKRKGKKDDYADIGMGYDESDSFIDNTDGYDEIIPQNVTTLHGGFYVNAGALVFKTDDEVSSEASSSSSSSSDSSSSESEGEEKPKNKRQKRVLETSEDSESDVTHKEKKSKMQPPAVSMQQAIKKKLFSTNKIQVKKAKALDHPKKTVKDLLREKREDLNMSVPDELKTVEDNLEKESSKENKKPMNITSVTDAIESVVKQVVEEETYDRNQNKQSIEVPPNPTSVPDTIDLTETEVKPEIRKIAKEEEIKLPENLPTDVATIISKLKNAAINFKGEKKKAFFTEEVNHYLLSLEKKSKSSLSKSSRIKVYEHLSHYINCTKDTLIRRAKILELEEAEKRLKLYQTKLKNLIDKTMPPLLDAYKLESQKVLERKFSKEAVTNEELKNLKLPRRKFQWTEEAKKLVKDTLSTKKRCLVIEGKHKDNLEEQLANYLRSVVLPLWPEGWMYLNNLKKVLNSMMINSTKSQGNTPKALNDNLIAINPPKHSNLSIIPVTNGKTSSENIEVTNNLTVTKISNDSKDGLKSNTKSTEINQTLSPINLIEDKITNTVNIETSKEHMNKKPTENLSISVDTPADLSAPTKKPDVFKPYINENPISQVQKLLPDIDSSQNVQKVAKQKDMFKPYADEISSDKSKLKASATSYKNNFLPHQSENDQSSHLEKVKNTTTTFSDKNMHNTYSDKDKLTAYSYDKEKHSTHTYSDKDKHNAHSYSDKDKHSSHSYYNKDKNSSHSYSDKDKQSNHSYSEKDKHTANSYLEKDKHNIHSISDKDKHSTHYHSDKNKHYSDKDKHYSDKDKYYLDKDKYYSDKDKHSMHSYPVKDRHNWHSHSDKHNSHQIEKDKSNARHYSERDKTYPGKDKHISSHFDNKPEEKVVHRNEKSYTSSEKPSDLSKSTLDFSKFQMFKPYDSTKSHLENASKFRQKDDTVKQRSHDLNKSDSSKYSSKNYTSTDYISSRYDVPVSKHSISNSIISAAEESGVIVKNLHQHGEKIQKDEKVDHNPVIPKPIHCQGVNMGDKRKIMESFSRNSTELNNSFFPINDYTASKSHSKNDGDGQQDIQMVMENLKALQKLSCSPVKSNDHSSSSPVSVIAYNKNFSAPKASSSHNSRDTNKNDFSGGFQDEFQKQFMSSLQQLSANATSNKSGYNNGS